MTFARKRLHQPLTTALDSETKIITSTDLEANKRGVDVASGTSIFESATVVSSQSMSASYKSSGIYVKKYTNLSLSFEWSSNNGTRPTVVIEGCETDSATDSDWAEINGSGQQLNDTSGKFFWHFDMALLDVPYYRIVYTPNDATAGSFTLKKNGKHI